MSIVRDTLATLAVRLERHALDIPKLALPEALIEVEDGLPDWWRAGANRLFLPPGVDPPGIGVPPGMTPPTGAVLILAAVTMPSILVWGAAPLIVLGVGSAFPSSWLCCGDGATIAVGTGFGITWNARIDSRNGGAVSIGAHGLWATGVLAQSDDMHAIRDLAGGGRLNPYGGSIGIAPHVWLGHEALLLPGARIGADTVIGARAVVSGTLPANAVCAGIPARTIRTGTTWAFEDMP